MEVAFHDRRLAPPFASSLGGLSARAPASAAPTCEVEPSYSQHGAKDAVFIEVELPGVARADLHVTVQGRRLVVVGKRFREPPRDAASEEAAESPQKADEKSADKQTAKTFKAVFRVPQIVDVDGIETVAHKDGVLTLRLPHAKAAQPRKIEIQ
ncbi:Heat Shock Protein 20, HSP20 [Chondrus crispus]|uniref:Heat Shock Protein 20, HSP20 n=1 Tax=Chondrus crispus TaxID=2769 RepID=R7QRA0_CHOCR|nr:Heat Shock Protein 20, HSP20 [Chondrus crispus]CDF40293.1 Heat Shock Protein 20, HSP20 [Chondrus crispus]|eukprot:XP_005710587.1 Heat Shock Protein 20, HSP20 [Chondrus crispus]